MARSFTSYCLEVAFLGLLTSLLIGTGYSFRVLLIYILTRSINSETGYRCLRSLPRDLSGVYLLIRIKLQMRLAFARNVPIHHYFLDWVKAHPQKPCMIEVETGRSLTFKEVNDLSNQYANVFKGDEHPPGSVIAMFLENSADFFAIWLGLSKIGIITAWINSHLKLEPLAHSIKTAECSTVITSTNLLPTLKLAIEKGLLPDSLKIFVIGDGDTHGVTHLSELLKDRTEPTWNGGDFKKILCYIYTSGTTGNPKAAIIKHYRYYFVTMASGKAFKLTGDDRLYVTMPMYHSAAGIIGVGQTIVRGCTSVIRKRFSASNFWKDAITYDCTASQYIGEICRYLLAQPKSPEERGHRIRLMYGNGLRGQIWSEFVRRFGVARIGEFYGSTEGNSNIINIDNRVGACGFFPIYPFVTALYPVRLVKVDPESGELLRDKNGLCISCQPGDTGEMVGLIKNTDPLLSFEGYVNQTDTKHKVLRDAFKKGDAVFSSGDILHWDKFGYLYFKDRRGDTYRWRGENVSTMEVEGVLQPIMSIEDATVFGVEISGREGRAGMIGATLTDGADVDDLLKELSARLSEQLASYAIPVFVRICKHVERTGTFKLKKTDLQKQGFDPSKCDGDSLFYWEYSNRQYLPLDQQQYESIQSGTYSKI
ncbi:Protein CBR-ACS-22 [Aphelenchoides besseyi]|nr:Protein CBR-ACS-22 [Aphelenchoides besseyi]